jgi:hypothetical protein
MSRRKTEHKKNKVMSIKVSYLPVSDADKLIWLQNFSLKIGTYANSVGITELEVESLNKEKEFYDYIINAIESYKQTLNSLIGYKNMVVHSDDHQELGPLPPLPHLPSAPAAISKGVFDRIKKMVIRIKASENYNNVIGQDLGIIAANTRIDHSEMQPKLRVRLDAGRPLIKSTKGTADGIDLYVNRNDGKDFTLLGRFLKTEYIDKAILPASTPLAEWEYKAMFVIKNSNVGRMSSVASIVVKKF